MNINIDECYVCHALVGEGNLMWHNEQHEELDRILIDLKRKIEVLEGKVNRVE